MKKRSSEQASVIKHSSFIISAKNVWMRTMPWKFIRNVCRISYFLLRCFSSFRLIHRIITVDFLWWFLQTHTLCVFLHTLFICLFGCCSWYVWIVTFLWFVYNPVRLNRTSLKLCFIFLTPDKYQHIFYFTLNKSTCKWRKHFLSLSFLAGVL